MSIKVRLRSPVLLALVARRNYSQNGLARGLGVSSGYMSQLLRGKRLPSPQMREKLMKFVGIEDFDELFIVEDERQ